MQSVDVLTRSRRDSAGGTPIRRGSAGAKHERETIRITIAYELLIDDCG